MALRQFLRCRLSQVLARPFLPLLLSLLNQRPRNRRLLRALLHSTANHTASRQHIRCRLRELLHNQCSSLASPLRTGSRNLASQ